MGAGNPKLKSFDNDKFEPTTYFLDITQSYEDTVEYLTAELGEAPSKSQIWSEIDSISSLNYEDFIESIVSELGHSKVKGGSHSELCYAYRESGIILTEGKTCYIVTESGSEFHHLPIAVIPNFQFEQIMESVEFEMWDKQEWYQARGKDWNAAVLKKANLVWNKLMRDFLPEAENILKTIHGWYGENMTGRCGPWLSDKVDVASITA
jgi:hypothetical protein